MLGAMTFDVTGGRLRLKSWEKVPDVRYCNVLCLCHTLTAVFSDMEFLEVLLEGLNRVLLVRGGGREVITIYS